VRVITDDTKADDVGSDVDRIAGAGIPVRVDRSPCHMHHKFAVLDEATLLTGSYNWTRSAAAENQENLVVSDDVRLVSPFVATFERLWASLG
jgi:phosphatidylserine/phosphatidylglycerophosphate/cardiolipin synthase-like enzyme